MISNKSKKTTVSKEHKLCKSHLSKTLGLMFRLKPKTLVFAFEDEKKVPLHMMFVFFPIDVVYLDKNKKVVEIKENFMPFTFYSPAKKSKYVVELPNSAASRSRTSVGDKLEF